MLHIYYGVRRCGAVRGTHVWRRAVRLTLPLTTYYILPKGGRHTCGGVRCACGEVYAPAGVGAEGV